MDAASRLFILMLIAGVIFGIIVILTVPEFRIPNIYQSNKNYYAAVTPESLKKTQ
jgi:cbb3-type cytochrome oxidase subunit 1